MSTKLLVVYYSSTGANYQLAQWAKEAGEAAGAEVRLRKVQELAPDVAIDSNPAWRAHVDATQSIEVATTDDLLWADSIVFSTPSRFGTMASQMKQFIDLQGGAWAQGKLANKFVTAFSTAQNPNGGQEEVVHGIYTVMQHWGTVIVPSGYVNMSTFGAGGNPYGTSATVGQDAQIMNADKVEIAAKDQVSRLIDITTAYLKGRN